MAAECPIYLKPHIAGGIIPFCGVLRAASGAVQLALNAVKRAIPSRLGRPLSPCYLPQPPVSRFPFLGAATTSLARLDSSCVVLPSKTTQATKSRWAPGPVESSGVGAALSPQRHFPPRNSPKLRNIIASCLGSKRLEILTNAMVPLIQASRYVYFGSC